MFLSLVRPDRISSPMTRMAAVTAGPLALVSFIVPSCWFDGQLAIVQDGLARDQGHDPEKWTPVFGKDHAQREANDPAAIRQPGSTGKAGVPADRFRAARRPLG